MVRVAGPDLIDAVARDGVNIPAVTASQGHLALGI